MKRCPDFARLLLIRFAILPGLFLSGCGTLPEASPVGFAGPGGGGRVIRGTVTEMRPTVMTRGESGLGSFIGGSAGMIGGSHVGTGHAAHAAGAIGGLIVGTIAGQQAERALARRKAWELWIRGDDGQEYVIPVLEPHPFVLDGRVRMVIGDFGHPASVHLETDHG